MSTPMDEAIARHTEELNRLANDHDVMLSALKRIILMCGGIDSPIDRCACGRCTGIGAVVACASRAIKRVAFKAGV